MNNVLATIIKEAVDASLAASDVVAAIDVLPKTSRAAKLRSLGFRKIGDGSSRAVYDLGNGTVLKLEKPGSYIRQNAHEAKISACTGRSKVLARILDHASDFSWIIQEKSDRVFHGSGPFLTTFNEVNGLSTKRLRVSYTGMIHYMVISQREMDLGQPPTEPSERARMVAVQSSPWWREFYRVVKTCNIYPGDLHAKNWGMVDGTLALLDYGFSEEDNYL